MAALSTAPHPTSGWSGSKERKMNTAKRFDTRKLVLLALLTAIVVVLQVLAIFIRPLLPAFTINLVLIPIVIGAALTGIYGGGWLGLVSGFAVLISGDAALFLGVNPLGTILVVLAKGLLSGLAAGAIYYLIAKKSRTIAAVAAAIVCPVVNTGVFIIGMYAFFMPTVAEWFPPIAGLTLAEGAGSGDLFAALGVNSSIAFIIIVMIGINFLIELGINIVLSPTIVRLIQYGQGRRKVVKA